MRLRTAKVQNYRSIIDSNLVSFDPEVTNIIGMTGSGKTSFLKMISGADRNVVFEESALPNGSQTQQDFHDGKTTAEKITQLTAVFEVEDSDRSSLPEMYRDTEIITLERRFDGQILVKADGRNPDNVALETEVDFIGKQIKSLEATFTSGVQRGVENLAQQEENFIASLDNFKETNFRSISEFDLSIATLRNMLNSIPADDPLRTDFNNIINTIVHIRNQIEQKLNEDPTNQLYDQIPKPLYKADVFQIQDEIPIDEFVADSNSSSTFRSIAVITGLTPSGLQKIRSAKTSERDSYLEAKSKKLSDRLNSFWSQEKYDFQLEINDGALSFVVSDKTTGIKTSVLDRSEGFKWWVAFFLELSTFLASRTGRSIVLLDNPATELHDEGKEDVLKFIRNAAKSEQLQIVYSTHERALIDPWRTDRVRIVELTSDGTKIENVRSKSRHDLLEVIRRNIGSPARYSLFGAPRTLGFEGVSDTYIVSAINEYLLQIGAEISLNKDSYSINAFNGVAKAPETCKLYKNLGLEFVLVVDSGSETESMKKNLEDGDFDSNFVEIKQVISKDGDIEDLIDPQLYYLAFKAAYAPLLQTLPTVEEIDSDSNKKRMTNYSTWFKSKDMEFNKTLVAQQMFNIMMTKEITPAETSAVDNTKNNFLKLFELISKKHS